MNPYWSNTVHPVRPQAVQEPQPPEPSQIFICGEPYTEPTVKIEISSDSEDVSGFSSNDDFVSPEDPESSELNKDHKEIENNKNETEANEGDKKEENEKEEEGASKKEKKLTHKCPICEKTFGRSYHVRYHMASHATELNYQCPECPKAFADDIRLGQHVKRVHAKGEPQICQICGKSFKSAEYLRLHSNRHSDVKKYGCELCGMRYTQSQHLKMHIMRVHEGKSVMEVRRKGRKPLVCTECGKTLWDMCNYRNHLASHTNEKAFKCPMCPKTFKLESYIKMHLRTHSDERPFVCEVCKKAFRRARDLTIHRARHMEKSIPCKLCDRAFRSRPLYRSHMVGIHRGIPLDITGGPLSCTLCQLICRDLEDLKDHVKMHEDDKPFECAICGDKFYDKLRIRRHIRQTHSEFARKKSKKVYHCPECSKICKGQQSFQLHRACHGVDKPVECKICFRKFNHKFYLGRHMIVHRNKSKSTALEESERQKKSNKLKEKSSKEKKIKCPHCGKEFKKSGFLRKHIEQRHADTEQNNKSPQPQDEDNNEVLPTEMVNVDVNLEFVKVECLEYKEEAEEAINGLEGVD